jgi:putative endonuclease
MIYYEEYDRIDDAIQREKNIKNWKRDWKTELINAQNPDWLDLYHDLSG